MSLPMDETTVDAHIETLLAEGVLDHDESTDELTTTDAFQKDLHVYYDTYLSVDDDEFHRSVAEAFDLPSPAVAAEHVERHGVTREELATYLALYARLEGYASDVLAEMAALVVEVEPKSPVPATLDELDDESYDAFLEANERAIVTVWKRGCSPCEGMKEDLDEILARLPDDAAVGGLDGEQCPEFCRSQEVNSAPAVVFYEDGKRLDAVTGRTSPGPLADRAGELYGDD